MQQGDSPGESPADSRPGARSSRSEERNAVARSTLRPLAPGERPLALVIAAALAAALALANLGAYLAGAEIDGRRPDLAPVLVFELLALAGAVALWRRSYWGVLGFEVAIGVTISYAALSLLVASNVAAVALCVAVIALGGWLFWKLIRVMGRIQTPRDVG